MFEDTARPKAVYLLLGFIVGAEIDFFPPDADAPSLPDLYHGLERHSACAGRRGLAFLETVEGAAAPTGVIDALDTYWILGCYLGRSGVQHAKPTYGS
jgi:hypothetical protein